MLKTILDVVKKTGNIFLTDITIKGTSFTQIEEDVAEFAILFAKASRMYYEVEQEGAIGELAFFFKGEKYLNLATNKEEDADGILEWVDFRIGQESVFIIINTPHEQYKITFQRIEEK